MSIFYYKSCFPPPRTQHNHVKFKAHLPSLYMASVVPKYLPSPFLLVAKSCKHPLVSSSSSLGSSCGFRIPSRSFRSRLEVRNRWIHATAASSSTSTSAPASMALSTLLVATCGSLARGDVGSSSSTSAAARHRDTRSYGHLALLRLRWDLRQLCLLWCWR